MPDHKWLDLQEEGRDWLTLVHQIGSHWIRTLAPFRNILAGEEVGFFERARNGCRGQRPEPSRSVRIDSTQIQMTCASSARCDELETKLGSAEPSPLSMGYPAVEGDPLIIREVL